MKQDLLRFVTVIYTLHAGTPSIPYQQSISLVCFFWGADFHTFSQRPEPSWSTLFADDAGTGNLKVYTTLVLVLFGPW